MTGGPPDPRLTRREAVAAAGALGLSVALAGCGQGRSDGASGGPGMCVLTPEQTEGPYYVEGSMVRRDLTEDQEGVPLRLRLGVREAGSCRPIAGASVEIWHCNALGVYSAFTAAGSGGRGGGASPPEPPANPGYGQPGDEGSPEDRTRFLRGAQTADRRGQVAFDTLYPGWYEGRTPHIHVKVSMGGDTVHTGQLYFDERVTEAVYRAPPYAAHGVPSTGNASDGVYADGGRESTLALSREGAGYVGRLDLGVGV